MKELYLNIETGITRIMIGRGLVSQLKDVEDRKIVVLIDENVQRMHPGMFDAYPCIEIPSGEKYKTLGFVEDLLRKMVNLEIDRTSLLIGVGGGLATDIAGFAASVYMRGIKFGFISTTLLGQVDASIGGKNGVNLDGFKNMIGNFNQPEFVWCDQDLLGTLPSDELVSGLAEVVKYGAIKNDALFSFIEKNRDRIISRDPSALDHLVYESARIKVEIVEGDVHEKGDRKLLNFGHTLGHAIEKLTGMLHGEAISVGMVMAAQLSKNMGFISDIEVLRIKNLLDSLGLPVSTDLPFADIFNALLKDKKRAGETIHFILLNRIGEAFVQEMELTNLKQMLYDLH